MKKYYLIILFIMSHGLAFAIDSVITENTYAVVGKADKIDVTKITSCMGVCIIGDDSNKACIHIANMFGHPNEAARRNAVLLLEDEWGQAGHPGNISINILKDRYHKIFPMSKIKKVIVFGDYSNVSYANIFGLPYNGTSSAGPSEALTMAVEAFGVVPSDVQILKFKGSTARLKADGKFEIDG